LSVRSQRRVSEDIISGVLKKAVIVAGIRLSAFYMHRDNFSTWLTYLHSALFIFRAYIRGFEEALPVVSIATYGAGKFEKDVVGFRY